MSLAMTRAEREEFLAGMHVGVISIPRVERGPLTVPIWYDYTPGEQVWVVTGQGSAKGKLLGIGTRVSLCAQTESLPYKYVSIEGPVSSVEPATLDGDLRPMATRYLGDELGNAYADESGAEGQVRVNIAPERWTTEDYAKR